MPDNLWDWWKSCFCRLWCVNCSSGVETWHFQFRFWAAARVISFALFWLSFCGTWFCPSGLCAGEGFCWLPWLQNNTSLLIFSSFHMSHRVHKKLLAFFLLYYCSLSCSCYYCCYFFCFCCLR